MKKQREKGVSYIQYTLCLCEIGQELEKLWEKYPAWRGAPYSFFHNRKLDSGAGDEARKEVQEKYAK